MPYTCRCGKYGRFLRFNNDWVMYMQHHTGFSYPHFIEKNGQTCAGSHLVIDLFGSHMLSDISLMERTFRRMVKAAGATLLSIHLHPFEGGGVTGVAVLAESHISVHTWPESGYAAFDIFMCGNANVHAVLPILHEAFTPERMEHQLVLRGILEGQKMAAAA